MLNELHLRCDYPILTVTAMEHAVAAQILHGIDGSGQIVTQIVEYKRGRWDMRLERVTDRAWTVVTTLPNMPATTSLRQPRPMHFDSGMMVGDLLWCAAIEYVERYCARLLDTFDTPPLEHLTIYGATIAVKRRVIALEVG